MIGKFIFVLILYMSLDFMFQYELYCRTVIYNYFYYYFQMQKMGSEHQTSRSSQQDSSGAEQGRVQVVRRSLWTQAVYCPRGEEASELEFSLLHYCYWMIVLSLYLWLYSVYFFQFLFSFENGKKNWRRKEPSLQREKNPKTWSVLWTFNILLCCCWKLCVWQIYICL